MDSITLPYEILSRDAARIARFLGRADAMLEEPQEIVVYGSAAVSLYFADEDTSDPAFTDDIDIQRTPWTSTTLRGHPPAEDGLHFEDFPIDTWLIHPSWRASLVDFTGLLGLQNLRVWLLSPRDLILTKLERYNLRDDEDCARLVKRYALQIQNLPAELEVALESSVGLSESRQDEIRRSVRWLME